MNKKEKTEYNTDFDYVSTDLKNQWVYLEKTISVPANIDKLNLRVGLRYGSVGQSVWFDDVKIERTGAGGGEILDEKNYYPFGLEHKGYNNVVNGVENKYQTHQGKELEKELGLNWHDFGARRYMADIGRTTTLDPLAEFMYSHSPYSFAFNNPIYFTDPSGMVPNGAIAFTDYYRDETGKVIFDPNVNGPGDVPGDGKYIGPTYTDPDSGTFWDENGNPHNTTQQLSAVVITAQESSEERSVGFTFRGIGTSTAGRKGTVTHSIEWDAFTSFGGGAKAFNRLVSLLQKIVNGLGMGWDLVDKVEDILKPKRKEHQKKLKQLRIIFFSLIIRTVER